MTETGRPLPFDGVPPRVHLTVLLCALSCAAFLAWAALGKLDVVSTATGEVVPQGKVRTVQHLEGGIVKEIPVHEGQAVTEGQTLVVLESTSPETSAEELDVRTNALKVDAVRLEAEVDGRERLVFPSDLNACCPDLTAQAQSLFSARRSRFQSEIGSQQDVIRQREQDIAEISVRLASQEERLKFAREQVALSEELLKEQLTTRYKHLAFLKEESELKSAIEQDKAGLLRARSALSQSRENMQRLRSAFQEEARQQLKAARQELDELTQRVRRVSDSLERTVIRSPVDGVVKALRVTTLGGVVSPGMTVAEVVPASERLIVQAHLPVSDIGYVHEGQDAVVKLASADARRFGQIKGKVVHVSPDSFVTPDGRAFYTVRIETEKDRFEQDSLTYRLYPGMQVLSYIHTGRRTILQYLTDPFFDSLGQAMQER